METTKCRRCKRPLTASAAKGIGPVCAKRERQQAAVSTYKPHQIESALLLIEDAAIIPLGGGAYIGVSTDGTETYECTTDTCTCAAYEAGRKCYHRAAAAMIAA